MKKTRFIPYGYTVKNGRTIIDHKEADVIRNIFANYIDGASLQEIADNLTKQKIPYTEKTDVWNKARIARIIENERYVGNEDYDPIIDESLYENAVLTKTARQSYGTKDECEAIALLRTRVKCEKCGSPMVRHTNSKYAIKESWTCSNPECGCKIRIRDEVLLDKVRILMNRIIKNEELMIPKPKQKYVDSPMVSKIQNEIDTELEEDNPNERMIIYKIQELATQLYNESDAKYTIAAQIAKQRVSMMREQEYFNTEYFTDIISYITLDEDKNIKLITKTETEIKESGEAQDGSN